MENNVSLILTPAVFHDEIWADKPSWWFKVWLFILLHVNHGTKGALRAGQGVFTRMDIYFGCGLASDSINRDSIENVIRFLKDSGRIETTRMQHGVLISISRYSTLIKDQKTIVKTNLNNNPTTHQEDTIKTTLNTDETSLFKNESRIRPTNNTESDSQNVSKNQPKNTLFNIKPAKPIALDTKCNSIYIYNAVQGCKKEKGKIGGVGEREGKECISDLQKSNHSVPEILLGLTLYEKDCKLCIRLPAEFNLWKLTYPNLDIPEQIRKAHDWEMLNPNRRKINRIKFLNRWLKTNFDSTNYKSSIRNRHIPEPIEIHKIILAYKIKKGFLKNDSTWDDMNYNNCRELAKQLFRLFGMIENAIACIDSIGTQMNIKNLSWNLKTVCNHASEYKLKIDKEGFR